MPGSQKTPPARKNTLKSLFLPTSREPDVKDGTIGPSSLAWRHERLMNIGGEEETSNVEESTTLTASVPNVRSYGTIQDYRRRSPGGIRERKSLPALAGLGAHSSRPSRSNPPSPAPWSPIAQSVHQPLKPVSEYDYPAEDREGSQSPAQDTLVNGIRVWYSSFSSVDWLHDAIKEASRRYRLQSRRSLRGQVGVTLDRSIDWFVVTIVGFLTAVFAFFIVRSEQLLFDFKEGHCAQGGWWRARRFCPSWETWAETFDESGEQVLGSVAWVIEYLSYAVVALILACISSLLTIYLTASNTFSTDKNSGVLAPDFKVEQGINTDNVVHKRKILFFAAGSGIPEIKTILSGFVIHGYLGGRTLFTKSLGLAMSVASGLSLGKEGPFVHIASCIGNIISRFFAKFENNEGKRREILSAAAAAGVAVAFGAPIGGVLFSLEEVSYYFPPKVMWQSFFCAMIAAITLRFLDPFGTGKLVLFQVTYDKDWHAFELIFFLILGVFGGVYGAFFSKMNYRWSLHVRNGTSLKAHPIMEVALVTLVTTLLCFLNPYTRMGGTELVANLFAECRESSRSALCSHDPSVLIGPVVQSIGVALVVKGLLTIVTFGIKLPAGIFIPTLGVGACFGRILGTVVHVLQMRHPDSPIFSACNDDRDCVIPGLYAMVGAAATLSGVTRTTVSLAVIMFELTDTLTYAVPVMLSILAAKTVADALEPKGIYDLVIDLSQLPYLDSKREYTWGKLSVSEVADTKANVIHVDDDNTVKQLRNKLRALMSTGYADSGFPIVKSDPFATGLQRVVGYIGVNELEHALAIVADEPDASCYFQSDRMFQRTLTRELTVASSSALESTLDQDPFDFTVYMDQAPLTIQTNSPLELVQQLFAKLGAKNVLVTDPNGHYEGVIDKNAWIAFLNELDA